MTDLYSLQQQMAEDRDEAEAARYVDMLFKKVAQLNEEYAAEFGAEYVAKHPLKIDHTKLHHEIMAELRKRDEA